LTGSLADDRAVFAEMGSLIALLEGTFIALEPFDVSFSMH
jgi:hypothetical protein